MTAEPGRDLSSFAEFALRHAQDAGLGSIGLLGGRAVSDTGTAGDRRAAGDTVPHGTTIVAIAYSGGVLLAGDRRATMGTMIATRDVDKVFVTDDYSAAGIAGTAGIAVELIKLFTVELEHYEKIEGVPLTLDGKASRLATMVRGNLGAALRGLSALPLLVGYDSDADPAAPGRIFSFDVAGAKHEELGGYDAIGSGSVFARSSLKKLYRAGLDGDQALALAVEALYDAADDDAATGGPDLIRRIFPTAVRVNGEGALAVSESEIARAAESVIARRDAESASEQRLEGQR